MKSLAFVKMQALGNDFVIIDRTQDNTIDLPLSLRQLLADRRLGIGCDQLLVIDALEDLEADCFGYRIFNQDGSEVEQCGNGARCVGRYLFDHGNVTADTLTLKCQAGLMTVKKNAADIVVNMGTASLNPHRAGFLGKMYSDRYKHHWDSECFDFGIASVGNPHAVLLVDEINLDRLDAIGAHLNDKNTGLFELGVNVGFMRIIDSKHIQLAVYERGVGRTLACGSGACAAVTIGQQWGELAHAVIVDLPGGQLQVTCENRQSSVWLKGAANYVFHGQMLV